MNSLQSSCFFSFAKYTAFTLLWLCLLAVTNDASCQTIPTFHPIAEHTYGIEDGLADMNMNKVLMDKVGRLHIETDGQGATAFGKWYSEYDGIRTYLPRLKLKDQRYHHFQMEGKDASGRIYGFVHYKQENNGFYSVVFEYDPLSGGVEETRFDRMVLAMTLCEGAFLVLVTKSTTRQYEIFRLQNGKAVSYLPFELERPFQTGFRSYLDAKDQDPLVGKADGWLEKEGSRIHLVATEQDFWAIGSCHTVYRINRKNGAVQHYKLGVLESGIQSVFVSPDQNIWIVPGWNFYQINNRPSIIHVWNHKTSSFISNPHKPKDWKDSDIEYAMAVKDALGNVLVSYRHKNKQVNASLFDSQGRLFDYTPVMSGHELAYSEDFKKGIVFFRLGLRVVDVALRNAVKKNTGVIGARQMLELNAQTIFVGQKGFLMEQNGAWDIRDTLIPIVQNIPRFKVNDKAKDGLGHIWFVEYLEKPTNAIKLMRYRPEQGVCDTFDVSNTFYFGSAIDNSQYRFLFDFLPNGHMALVSTDRVYIRDVQTGALKLLAQLTFKEKPNQLFVSKEGLVWVATTEGVLKIDPRSGSKEWIRLMPDRTVNVMRILQDKKGRLWLGTVPDGILIYDPATEKKQTIDQSNGLSNNIVVSLLEDNDGDIWAGTFYGLTVLSQEGAVIGRLYEEDGLSNNECNRWSAMKMKDGRLCFGSIAGVTIIDPALWKSETAGHPPPGIFLTEIYSEGEKGASSERKDYLSLYRQNQRIVLPATNRNLKLAFGFSNYASPEKSTFAYLIEGVDKEWHFIGAQRQLSLSALPAGRYNILIRGADGRGKWTETSIVIPVEVEVFFYKQWWFFVLCALPFLAFFLLWQNRQRGEQKRLEQEVQNRTTTIQQQADKLLEMDLAKSRLYTNITHEFRTPLTVISGMAEMIEKPTNTKDIIQRNSQGLLHLVNQMLDLAKLESGNLQLELVQTDVLPYVQYLFESFQSFACGKRIKLIFEKKADRLVMDFDETRLGSVLSNLLSNAIKFSNENGWVRLQLEEENGHLLLIVTDNGIDIPPEKLPHIFDRFFQVDSSYTRRGDGTGIGLTLTKELVELMGGNIAVQSPAADGVGTTFTVSLPINQNAPMAAIASPDDWADLPILSSDTEGVFLEEETTTNPEELPLLLLIEDNTDVATYIQVCLKNRYTVDWANNGDMGIEKAFATIPDVILSDVMMPEKDGFEVCQTLKNDERTSHIPIVLLTAKADVASRLEGLGVGADAYLSKPFLKAELFIYLENLVELRRKLQARYADISKDVFPKNVLTGEQTSPTLDDIFLQKIRGFVEAKLDDPEFGNTELARKMFLSESQLFRKIKALTGQSTAIHIRSIRLKNARTMLQNSDRSVAEIAYLTGFTDPSYFTRVFSKEFGDLPGNLRK